jgi:hypothetical protein
MRSKFEFGPCEALLGHLEFIFASWLIICLRRTQCVCDVIFPNLRWRFRQPTGSLLAGDGKAAVFAAWARVAAANCRHRNFRGFISSCDLRPVTPRTTYFHYKL